MTSTRIDNQRIRPPTGGAFAEHLVRVTEAFNRGDYAGVRDDCRRVLDGDARDDERRYAEQLLWRTGADRVALAVGALVAVFVAVVVIAGW